MKYLTQGLLYIVIVGVGLFLVIPNTTDQQPQFPNEASAISGIRDIVTSQITYSDTMGRYAPDLATLWSLGVIDSVLASGTKDGYTFRTTRGRDGSTFTVTGTPLSRGKTGNRSFYADETGVIRYTVEDRPATADDPPIGQ